MSSLVDELQAHRQLSLERAKMEVDFQTKLKALEKVKTALANAPDLDIEKVNYRNSKFLCLWTNSGRNF